MNTRIAAGLAALLIAGPALAQSDRFAPTVLQLPASARALGVGDAFTAGRGSEMIFYNPAMLALQPGMAISGQRLGSSATFGALSSSMSIGNFGIGLGAQALEFEYDDLLAAPTALPSLPAGSSSSLAATVGVAAQLFGVRFGGSAKYLQEEVGGFQANGAAFDLGAAKDLFGRATVAIAARDIGEVMHFDNADVDLPTRVSLGASASAPAFTFVDLAATAAITWRRDGEFIPAGGIEASYVPLDGWAFTGRVGARKVADRSGASPLTLGAGISFDRLSLDYAYGSLEVGGTAHRIGLRIR
jgi:hypothetical protein